MFKILKIVLPETKASLYGRPKPGSSIVTNFHYCPFGIGRSYDALIELLKPP